MLVFAICLAQGFVGLGGKVGGPLGQGGFGLGRALEEGGIMWPKLRLMVFSFRRRMILRKEWLEPFRICFLIFKWVVI